MSNQKILDLERKLDKLRISNLEEKVKILTKRISKLEDKDKEDKDDYFAVGNCVKLKNGNGNVLKVVHVTPKSVWLRHGNKKKFLKRKYNVEKVKINN